MLKPLYGSSLHSLKVPSLQWLPFSLLPITSLISSAALFPKFTLLQPHRAPWCPWTGCVHPTWVFVSPWNALCPPLFLQSLLKSHFLSEIQKLTLTPRSPYLIQQNVPYFPVQHCWCFAFSLHWTDCLLTHYLVYLYVSGFVSVSPARRFTFLKNQEECLKQRKSSINNERTT